MGHPDAIYLAQVPRANCGKGTAMTVYVDYESGGIKYQPDLTVSTESIRGNPRGCLSTQTS
jgi:hypothetical protein